MTKTAELSVAEHLRPECKLTRPCTLLFNTGGSNVESLEGAYYEQDAKPPEGAINPQPYVRSGFWLKGIPKCYIKKVNRGIRLHIDGSMTITPRHVCFVLRGMPGEWYIACYFMGEPNKLQPFGNMCVLSEWKCDGPIDEYEAKPRVRIPVRVVYADQEEEP